MNEEKILTLEEKVDQILEYQKKAARYAGVRIVMNIILFVLVVVLPILGAFWLGDYLTNELGFDTSIFKKSLQELQSITELNSTQP